MFKKIILVYKEGLQKSLFEKIEEVKLFFPEANFLAINYNSIKKDILAEADLIITLGGDGTFIKSAQLIENTFIFGINSNPKTSEGVLTSITIDELDKLKFLNEGKFEIIERQRADVFLNGKLLDERALNEVYVGAASQFHTSRYKIKFKEKEEEQRSSGILISTGTGSEAWFLSAGGKPFNHDEKKLKFVVREPYFGKRLFTPTLLDGEILEKEQLIAESTREFGGVISVGDSVYDFNRGDITEVKLSNKPLKVIKFK